MPDDATGIGNRLRQVFFTGVAVIVPPLISPNGDRSERYDARVDPEKARTSGSIVDREREAAEDPDADVTTESDGPDAPADVDGEARTTPAERAGRYDAEREETEAKPSEQAGRSNGDRDETEGTPAERAGGATGDSAAEDDADDSRGDDS